MQSQFQYSMNVRPVDEGSQVVVVFDELVNAFDKVRSKKLQCPVINSHIRPMYELSLIHI